MWIHSWNSSSSKRWTLEFYNLVHQFDEEFHEWIHKFHTCVLGLLVPIKAVNCKEIVEAGSIFQVRPTAYMYY